MGKDFALMVKPVGSSCDLRCTYCYYLPVQISRGRMSHETAETLIRNAVAASNGPVLSFVWHGGEPTLAGMDFYRDVLELQKKYLPEGWQVWNNLQTNGFGLNEEWCEFLAGNHFDVGISLDGTKETHDRQRKSAAGEETYDRIAEHVRMLERAGIRPDLLCTVNSVTVRQPMQVYSTLRDLGTGWIQFIPVVNRSAEGGLAPESVDPEAYGEFLCTVFNRWLYHDLGRVNVQLFVELANMIAGEPASLCWLRERCGDVPVIEADGAVYACDHFVRKDHRIGEIGTPLDELLDTDFQRAFGAKKKDGLTEQCLSCPYLRLCNGGCPKDRFGISADGEKGHNVLCPGLTQLFRVAEGPLKRLVELNGKGYSKEQIMTALRKEEQERWAGIGRNDPCPCGSGKKAKRCCLPRRP